MESVSTTLQMDFNPGWKRIQQTRASLKTVFHILESDRRLAPTAVAPDAHPGRAAPSPLAQRAAAPLRTRIGRRARWRRKPTRSHSCHLLQPHHPPSSSCRLPAASWPAPCTSRRLMRHSSPSRPRHPASLKWKNCQKRKTNP